MKYSYPSLLMLLHKESVYHTCVHRIAICNLQSLHPPLPHGWLSLSHCNPLRLITVPATRSAMLTDPIVLQCIIALHCKSAIAVQSVDESYLSIIFTIHIYTIYFITAVHNSSAECGWWMGLTSALERGCDSVIGKTYERPAPTDRRN